ncbi:siderophore-interacting protein [Nonomuraea jiangxiensis]|uniref:NADPH-dependent ferric siderophore reductase, contains FAD-binding and SIP domains n=1 Tax=Nonomuraea jiangxiensis TaxID=633440 RepID=A0A1G8ZEF7_9ACTN|nr:siderophore-interacting protein [Nonomuraea jiangxiensis]SDK13408.1 NADPH-dependent ferric siderophore reductase, contains FAD-binding and SIP domains [Nonomuraea jiangxiensis]
MTVARRLLDRMFLTGEVVEVERVTARMRRVRIGGEALAGLKWTPGQHVRLLVGEGGLLGGVLRTYSIWDYDPTWEAVDLIGYDHGGDSPGTSWIRKAEPGREVSFTRPDGGFVVQEDAPYHLFAGEETASVAFGAMLGALPGDARVFGAIEADSPGDHLDLHGDLVRVSRKGASAAGSAALVNAVRELDLPDEPGVAYLAGEARTIQAVRAHLVGERGWRRRDVRTKPFWTPGRRGLD